MKNDRQRILRGVAILAAVFCITILTFSLRPQAQEPSDEEEAPKVTESELQLYIDVYTAMQADHSLTLEEALKLHSISLEQFRNLERRVQRDQRYVDRVRKALLDYAKSRMLDSKVEPVTTPGASTPNP